MNRNTMIFMLIACGLLLVAALWLRQSKQNEATPTSAFPVSQPVWSLSADQISGVRLSEAATGQSVAVAKDAAGVWTISDPVSGTLAADQAVISQSLPSLAGLTYNTVITGGEALPAYGLQPPLYQLEIKLSDGRQLKAGIGDKILTGTGYYLLREGETAPLVIDSYALDTFVAWLAAPPYPPTPLPTTVLISPTVTLAAP